MGDIMRPVPFSELLKRMFAELRNEDSIFGLGRRQFFEDDEKKAVNVFGQVCSTPCGPAAGPHTQLAQNIITAYLAGGRFIELKTVQIMDTLDIDKPCIDARDEGYNVEWSTEYTLPKAFDEYLKDNDSCNNNYNQQPDEDAQAEWLRTEMADRTGILLGGTVIIGLCCIDANISSWCVINLYFVSTEGNNLRPIRVERFVVFGLIHHISASQLNRRIL